MKPHFLTTQVNHDFCPARDGVLRPASPIFLIAPAAFAIAFLITVIGIPTFYFLTQQTNLAAQKLELDANELREQTKADRLAEDELKDAKQRALRLGQWINRHPPLSGSLGVLVSELPGSPQLTGLGLMHLDDSLRFSLSTPSDTDLPAAAVTQAYHKLGSIYGITPRQFPQTTRAIGVTYDAIFFFDRP